MPDELFQAEVHHRCRFVLLFWCYSFLQPRRAIMQKRAELRQCLGQSWRSGSQLQTENGGRYEVELNEQEPVEGGDVMATSEHVDSFSAAPGKAKAPCNILQFDNVGINGTNDGL